MSWNWGQDALFSEMNKGFALSDALIAVIILVLLTGITLTTIASLNQGRAALQGAAAAAEEEYRSRLEEVPPCVLCPSTPASSLSPS